MHIAGKLLFILNMLDNNVLFLQSTFRITKTVNDGTIRSSCCCWLHKASFIELSIVFEMPTF